MVSVTCLSPTKSYSYCPSAFAHLELLIFNLQTAILLLGAINEQPYKTIKKIHLRTIHQNKKKTLKGRTKGYGSLLRLRERKQRENGAKTAILWVKR